MIIGDEVKCRKGVYHDYVLSRDLADALIEICRLCGKKTIYNKGPKGRIDNARYLKEHLRDTVQPWGKTKKLFFQIYGEKPLKELYKRSLGQKSKEEIQAEWDELRREIRERHTKIII